MKQVQSKWTPQNIMDVVAESGDWLWLSLPGKNNPATFDANGWEEYVPPQPEGDNATARTIRLIKAQALREAADALERSDALFSAGKLREMADEMEK